MPNVSEDELKRIVREHSDVFIRVDERLRDGAETMTRQESRLDLLSSRISVLEVLMTKALANDEKILVAIYERKFRSLVLRFGVVAATAVTAFFNHFKGK